jgi:hypothetical protein
MITKCYNPALSDFSLINKVSVLTQIKIIQRRYILKRKLKTFSQFGMNLKRSASHLLLSKIYAVAPVGR